MADTELQVTNTGLSIPKGELIDQQKRLHEVGYYEKNITPSEYLDKSYNQPDTDTDLELTPRHDVQPQQRQQGNLAPLKYWKSSIVRKFDECTDSQKKAWLDSFKLVEKGHVKQVNALKQDLLAAQPVFQELLRIASYFNDPKCTESPAEYIRRFIDFDIGLGKDAALEIAKLIAYYNFSYETIAAAIPVAIEEIKAQSAVNKAMQPYMRGFKRQATSQGTAANAEQVDQRKAQEMADDLGNKIEMFYNQKDRAGNEMYPNWEENIDDIIEVLQTGDIDLDEAYRKVVGPAYAEENVGTRPSIDNDIGYNNRGRKLTPAEEEKQYLNTAMNKLQRGY